ncbi:MAG: hypothetical protein JWR51_4529 [Devosia sp.]|uniref:hypothetical protein n=1 Tax=Devosia sp. TaxID=1871048 RepID=UPI00262B50EB|nr:hypothetical protein [Devosia sp.]MDB5531426.1 hypothetical protein [Devosia sp.]
MRITAMITVFAALCAASPAWADEVPADILGHWALDGQCDKADKSIHIDATTLAFGAQKGDAVEFMTDDSPAGNGAIHWSEEGVVDNFEFDTASGTLLHNTEGYGMGLAPEVYKRCKA